ncbi:hypothetical protein SASPL_105111 [Salvia splendens]|uniref:Uncharacterized protein n=1 Tax=Salvia splendens TaxID=180675 RepID=A0A8X9A911_SALSN|nr:hypothetical protein SASPL_105111 [Salvia splendens]
MGRRNKRLHLNRQKEYLPSNGLIFLDKGKREVEKEVYNELVPPDRYGRVVGYGLGVSARMVHGTKNYAGVIKDAKMEELVQARVEKDRVTV